MVKGLLLLRKEFQLMLKEWGKCKKLTIKHHNNNYCIIGC